MSTTRVFQRGVVVTLAGTGINLALGVLYTWSIFKAQIKQSIAAGGADAFSWDPASINDPYAVCCLMFAACMVIAGRCQDSLGPRVTATIGGVLVSCGFAVISISTSYWIWIIGFGVLAGSGIAFGYSSALPPALKWFHPSKTGRISGIVISGFGLASVYIAPLSAFLLTTHGLPSAMMPLGIGFLVAVGLCALLLVNPPTGYVPPGTRDRRERAMPAANVSVAPPVFRDVNETPSSLMKTGQFWLLWLLFAIGAGTGLMVIGSLAGMAKQGMGSNAFLAVAILAIGNAAGRIIVGMASDRYGRRETLVVSYFFQALLMLAGAFVLDSATGSALVLMFLATFIGFNYGAALAIFPSFAKDLWGAKHFGANYGVLFTAWGVSGFLLGRISEEMIVSSGGFFSVFVLGALLLVIGAVLGIGIDDHKHKARLQARAYAAAVAAAAATAAAAAN